MMNKAFLKKEFLSLLLLCSLPACGPFKRKKQESTHATKAKTEIAFADVVDMPLAEQDQSYASLEEESFDDQDDSRSFIFNDDDFIVLDDTNTEFDQSDQELSWEQDQMIAEFKNIYFEFDEYKLNEDQRPALEYNINLAKQKLAQGQDSKVLIIIEGHSCHSSGTPAYNLALSEKRAQVLAEQFIQAGITPTSIKIVGRGQEIPATDGDGKQISGSRDDQWLNRRDEIKIISA